MFLNLGLSWYCCFLFQFYKDTLKDEPSPEKEIKKERSPSPEEETEGGGDIKTEGIAIKQEIKTEPDTKMETDPGTLIFILF